MSRESTNAAIAAVDAAADEHWKATADQVVQDLAERMPTLTTDDVLVALERDHPDAHTHELRALGAVMRRAQSAGLIENSGEYRRTQRGELHGSPTVLWTSLLYGINPRRARLEAALRRRGVVVKDPRPELVKLGWIEESAKSPTGYAITAKGQEVIGDDR